MTRWSIFLAGYSYRLVHRPGKNMGNADALSRCPLPDILRDPVPDIPVLLIDTLPLGPLSSDLVARATSRDPILRRVMGWILRGWPPKNIDCDFYAYFIKRAELSVMKGCILWGDRVVIPCKLRQIVMDSLHEGHPGVVRMKGLARSYVWWPRMDQEIEDWVGRCRPCQESRPDPPVAPVREWEPPQGPWSRIHVDFAGPFHGNMFLIIVDAYSKWLEIEIMHSTTADSVIRVLRRLFTVHGLPDTLVSDNGPQFTATAFEGYLATQGIRHALSAPFHPASNGLAERFVRSAKEALSRLSDGDWQARVDKFLAVQHAAPCTATGKSPAELLMGRKLRCLLDRLHPLYSPDLVRGKEAQLRTFQVGDQVFTRNYATGPLWVEGIVAEVTGPKSYRINIGGGRMWKRHIDQVRSHRPGTLRDEYEVREPNFPASPLTASKKPKKAEDLAGSEGKSILPAEEDEPVAESTSPMEARAVPGAEPGEGKNPSSQLDAPKPNELRRSSRIRQRPGHLSDYIVQM